VGSTLVDGSLGELVGQTYVNQLLPARSKAMMEQLVENLKAALRDRIRANSWMASQTKSAALDQGRQDAGDGRLSRQLARLFGKLTISPDDLYGNVQRSGAFEYAYSLRIWASRSIARNGE
jgi:putative endopeptidase